MKSVRKKNEKKNEVGEKLRTNSKGINLEEKRKTKSESKKNWELMGEEKLKINSTGKKLNRFGKKMKKEVGKKIRKNPEDKQSYTSIGLSNVWMSQELNRPGRFIIREYTARVSTRRRDEILRAPFSEITRTY